MMVRKRDMARVTMTMVEVAYLIGVALITLALVSLLVVTAREKARRHSCSGGVKSMGVALLMYSGDFSGLFPPTPEGNSLEPLNTASYLKDSKIYQCPSAGTGKYRASDTDYWYVAGGLRDDNSAAKTTRVLFDQFGNHSGEANKWMNVLFVDGHVEGGKPGKELPFVNMQAVPINQSFEP